MSADQAMKLILASSSPRRRELLAMAGLAFEVIVPEVEEKRRTGESPEAYVLRNAREKAEWVARKIGLADDSVCVLAADTIVVLGDDVLEKPRDADDARSMLARLSGATHTVISGVAMISGHERRSAVFPVHTSVTFKTLSVEEIDAYVASGEPEGKAGAYAIQGRGGSMVKALAGSYTNVVGLPLAEVLETLEDTFGWRLFGARREAPCS